LRILKGAQNLINENRIKLVYSEIILVSTYEGQAGITETLSFFQENGFELYGFYNLDFQKYNLNSHKNILRQVDGLFINREAMR